MTRVRFKHYFIGLSMFAAAGLAVALTPNERIADREPSIDLEVAIPQSFGDWKVDETVVPINPSPDQQKTLNEIYDQIVSRTYVNARGQKVMLSVAYGKAQTQGLRAHRQEVCYSAQGFQINSLSKEDFVVDGITVPATRMVAVRDQRNEPVTYWFTMGDSLVRSLLDRQVTQLKYSLTGAIPDGYLFRVSSINGNAIEAYENQTQFVQQLMKSIDPALRRKLLGSA